MLTKVFIVISVVFYYILTTASAAKILAVVPMPTYSHQTAFRKIWIELSLRGHEVTVITADPMNNEKLVNLTEINMHDIYKLKEEYLKTIQGKGFIQSMIGAANFGNTIVDFHARHPDVQKLLNKNTKFDAVIVESLFLEFLVLADFFNCPKILVASLDLTPIVHDYLGNPVNPIAHPDWVLPYVSAKLNFFERIYSFFHLFSFSHGFYLYYIVPARHKIMKHYISENVRDPIELLKETDLVLVNTNPVLSEIRAIGPNVIPFGGGNHIVSPKPLPKDLKEFLDSATDGFIYFSLGTNAKSMYMAPEKIQVILETLSELPYKVLWKFEAEGIIQPPKSVKLMPWIPQQDVLRHPNIKLFITQGGIQSLEEAIINKVPMVVLPMYADQHNNAVRMQERGFGRVVKHHPTPVKEDFKNIILDVITDPKYKQNVTKASELILDQPTGGIDRAVWWIEYVIRHKGAKHLRNASVDIPIYQYYGLDIIATILVFIYIAYRVLICIKNCLKNLFASKKKVSPKKKKQ